MKRWNEHAENYLCEQEEVTGKEYKGRGTEIKYVRNTIAPPQDDSQGFAITAEMRDTQHKLNRLRKYQMLKQKHKEHEREGTTLYQKLEGEVAYEHLQAIEEKLDSMRNKLRNERNHRWKSWVQESWANNVKAIYKWVKGKKGSGPLIVTKGGSAQMKERLKTAHEAWGGLWAVEADELPVF